MLRNTQPLTQKQAILTRAHGFINGRQNSTDIIFMVENRLTITDMIRILEGSKNLKSALSEIGIDISDIVENREKLYGR